MNNTTVLKFATLANLANYIKAVRPSAYIVNTLRLTLLANLSEFEIGVALEQYSAQVFSDALVTEKTQ